MLISSFRNSPKGPLFHYIGRNLYFLDKYFKIKLHISCKELGQAAKKIKFYFSCPPPLEGGIFLQLQKKVIFFLVVRRLPPPLSRSVRATKKDIFFAASLSQDWFAIIIWTNLHVISRYYRIEITFGYRLGPLLWGERILNCLKKFGYFLRPSNLMFFWVKRGKQSSVSLYIIYIILYDSWEREIQRGRERGKRHNEHWKNKENDKKRNIIWKLWEIEKELEKERKICREKDRTKEKNIAMIPIVEYYMDLLILCLL